MLTEPPKNKLNLFQFPELGNIPNVDLGATKTMVSIKTGIESQTYNSLNNIDYFDKFGNPTKRCKHK